MYGAVKDFKSVALGIQVFKFAHEMQIDSLLMTDDIVEFFKENQDASDIFSIFDLYHKYDNQLGIEACKEVRNFFAEGAQIRTILN